MKTKNVVSLLILIDRYNKITLEEIENVWKKYHLLPAFSNSIGDVVAGELTHYSELNGCILCQEAQRLERVARKGHMCYSCVYCLEPGDTHMCIEPLYDKDRSFNDIGDARTPTELLKAYRARAEVLKRFYDEYYAGEENLPSRIREGNR